MNADRPNEEPLSGADHAIDGLLHEVSRTEREQDVDFLNELEARLNAEPVNQPVPREKRSTMGILIPWIAGIAATLCLLAVILPSFQASKNHAMLTQVSEVGVYGDQATEDYSLRSVSADGDHNGLAEERYARVNPEDIRRPLYKARASADSGVKYAKAPASPEPPKPAAIKAEQIQRRGMVLAKKKVTLGGTVLSESQVDYGVDAGFFDPSVAQAPGVEAERYGQYTETGFRSPLEHARSTFSIDVDTASYANLRRMIQDGSTVPPQAVRIEEMINYFGYHYGQPKDEHPFAVHLEAAACPWNPDHQLVRVGLKGREIVPEARPSANLVFLLDVSGSMNTPRKLPLLKSAMHDLVNQLTSDDVVSIVVYAGREGLALEPTSGDNKEAIHSAIDRLNAGGSTAGAAGIQLAYKLARQQFVKGGINRVLLGTDGDFNVGISDNDSLVALVEREAKSKVFLTVLGFGRGNLNDHMLEEITNKGNGSYHYIDSGREGRKVLVEQMSGTLQTIAKDVKIQVEFNPAYIKNYRLVGYDNRRLRDEDFTNDLIDAGDIGSGHTVTALYEIELVDGVPAAQAKRPGVEPLKYQQEIAPQPEQAVKLVKNGEWMNVKLRYKQPDADVSIPLEHPLRMDGSAPNWGKASPDFRFASAVAGFGLILRESAYKGQASRDLILELVDPSLLNGEMDPQGRKAEFVELVRRSGR